MQVVVWPNLDYVMCVHLIDFAPRGGRREAGGWEWTCWSWSWALERRQAELEKKRPGIKKEIRAGATTHLPTQLVSGWVIQSSHCERVVWIVRRTVPYSQAAHTAQVWHCMLRAGGINWKGRWTPEATRRSWVPQAKILPWVAAWRQGQGAELD